MENQFIYKPSKIVELMEIRLDEKIKVSILRNYVASYQQEINHVLKRDLSKTNINLFLIESITLNQRLAISHLCNCQDYIRRIIKDKIRKICMIDICINYRSSINFKQSK